jgi:hypothetical protein
MSSLPQAVGNAVISCIHAAQTKYESNPLDWQRVVEIGWHLLTRQDMERFQEMCKDGLLRPGDYGIFEDWSAIDRLRDGYVCIREGLVSEGEVQEIDDEEKTRRIFTMRSCTRPVFVHFSWHTTRCLLIVGGSYSVQQIWSVIASLR